MKIIHESPHHRPKLIIHSKSLFSFLHALGGAKTIQKSMKTDINRSPCQFGLLWVTRLGYCDVMARNGFFYIKKQFQTCGTPWPAFIYMQECCGMPFPGVKMANWPWSSRLITHYLIQGWGQVLSAVLESSTSTFQICKYKYSQYLDGIKYFFNQVQVQALWGWFCHDVLPVTWCEHGPPSIVTVNFS